MMKKRGGGKGATPAEKVSEEEVFGGIEIKVIKGRKSQAAEGPLLSGDRVVVTDHTLASQLFNKSFGDMKRNKVYLNLYEACLLVDEGKLDISDKGKSVDLRGLLNKGKRLDKDFAMKYDVFRDLRMSRGYVTKSGIKFGADFVVYDRGKSPGKAHSKWMVKVVPEIARMNLNDITLAARLATNVKKRMIYAVVTERGPVYYEVARAKF